MRGVLLAPISAVVLATVVAQTANSPAARSKTTSSASAQMPIDLPVHKVVLYKNGVGYFEHAGTVNGNQRVSIDFTSEQLNDVLQSLTAFDQGGGRIGDVNYNSTTPLAEQLKSLALGLDADTTYSKFFTAVRGARVEVHSGASTFTGRIMDIEMHKTGTGKDNSDMVEKRFLTVVSDAGEVRIFELSPVLGVRLLDPQLHGDVNRYLELLNEAHETGLRHLTLDAMGKGERELRLSYISQVPVWKSTYRIVLPQSIGTEATVQGWAVVDNTVGADWDNVQLSLVAGAPQSFIQPLSQPLYTNRPIVPIATVAQNAPQTHEAPEMKMSSAESVTVNAAARMLAPLPSFSAAEGVASGGGLGSGSGNGYGPGVGGNAGGGIYRASDAIEPGEVSTNAFDDYFEYALTQPVTIHKNESAMVPILQQELPVERVTLWSDKSSTPLRALSLDNTSKLTLDAGSFSILENGEFAGEGLLDPIHPGEKRLLSYAVDQAVRVHRGGYSETRFLRHVAMHDGVMTESTTRIDESTYTVTNSGDDSRMVIVEHTRRGAELDSDPKPAETTPTAYRFRVAVEPHQSVNLHVGEETKLSTHIRIDPAQDWSEFLLNTTRSSPELEAKLQPLVDAVTALHNLNHKLEENQNQQKTLEGDEARARDNLTALKGNEAARRFVDELNRAEDAIDGARKEEADLKTQRDAAQAHLDATIAQVSFDADVNVKTQSTQYGDRAPQQ